jgi:hypothetical protein
MQAEKPVWALAFLLCLVERLCYRSIKGQIIGAIIKLTLFSKTCVLLPGGILLRERQTLRFHKSSRHNSAFLHCNCPLIMVC